MDYIYGRVLHWGQTDRINQLQRSNFLILNRESIPTRDTCSPQSLTIPYKLLCLSLYIYKYETHEDFFPNKKY